MKRKISKISTLLFGLCALFGFSSGNKTVEMAKATKGAGDEQWSLIGSVTNPATGTKVSWDTDFDLTYNATAARYELVFAFNVGDTFKIRYNHAWSVSIGYGENTGGGIGTYLTNDGDNFKVKTAGTYLLKVTDDNVANYGDKSYGFSIETATITKYTVTYYNGTKQIDTASVAQGTVYNGKFVYQEGYRLQGWYKDAALTQPYTATAIQGNMSLYGKYEAAENFGLYMKNTRSWTNVNVYLWNSTYGHNNAAWPGIKMTAVTGTDYYYTEIDTAYSFDKIIFNDGVASGKKEQTENLNLADQTVCYVIGALQGTDEEGTSKFNASVVQVRKVIAYVPGDVYSYEELGYTGETATGTGFAVIALLEGNVAVTENDSSITVSEKEAALIERFAKVDTCKEYSQFAVYRNLVTVSGLDNALSLSVTDAGGTVTIGDKLDYMEYLDSYYANNPSASSASHTILAGGSTTNLWFVIMIGVLGLGSVLGYYFLSKKRFSK